MATYEQIKDVIRARTGKSVKCCWIAHVKDLNGLPMRLSRRGNGPRVVPCPDEWRPIIEDEMRRQGMLPPLAAE